MGKNDKDTTPESGRGCCNSGDCCCSGGCDCESGECQCECRKQEVAELCAQVELLKAELEDKRLRMLAELQNERRKAAISAQQSRQEGMTAVLRGLIPVLDQLDLAAGQELTPDNAEQIARGVVMIKEQLLAAAKMSGIDLIHPTVGDEFDSSRHEAVVQQPGEGVAPGHVSIVLRPGYAIGEMVVRPAQVAVAPTNV